jgi:hypothetical protein
VFIPIYFASISVCFTVISGHCKVVSICFGVIVENYSVVTKEKLLYYEGQMRPAYVSY